MRFAHLSTDTATWERTVRGLIDERVPEDRDLDYKREIDLATPGGRRDVAVDIAALANSVGGILVCGVEELRIDGKPTNLPEKAVGVTGVDEKVIQRIEDLARDLIRPSLSAGSLDLILVPGIAATPVLVIRARQSLLGPHMVEHRVHARNSAGTYRVEIEELRRMILEQHVTRDDIAKWLKARSSAIPPVQGGGSFLGESALCVRAIPLFNRRIDIGSSALCEAVKAAKFRAGESHTFHHVVYSAEGLAGRLSGHDNKTIAALAVLRGLGVEWVSSLVMCLYSDRDGKGNEVPVVGLPNLAHEIFQAARESVKVLETVIDPFPLVIQVSLHGAAGRVAHHGGHYWFRPEGRPVLQQDPLVSDAVVWPTASVDVYAALRPLLDFFWQALGEPRCAQYDDSGHWKS